MDDVNKPDNILKPAHYTGGRKIEPIDFIRASLTPEEFRGHCMACVIKYVTRHMYKNGVEDLKKAKQYLDWLIKEEQKYESN